MASLPWPLEGRCGACGRPARQFPSLRWEHVGVPCQARTQSVWRIDDADIKLAVVFVPDGEPLPTEPEKGHWHTVKRLEDGFPAALGWCNADHRVSVREWLVAEAESRELAASSPEVQP